MWKDPPDARPPPRPAATGGCPPSPTITMPPRGRSSRSSPPPPLPPGRVRRRRGPSLGAMGALGLLLLASQGTGGAAAAAAVAGGPRRGPPGGEGADPRGRPGTARGDPPGREGGGEGKGAAASPAAAAVPGKTPLRDRSPSSSALAGLALALRKSLPPRAVLARHSLTAAQLTVAYYLLRTTWDAVSEALQEVAADLEGLGGGGGMGGGGVAAREEHDRTWLDGDGVDEAVEAAIEAEIEMTRRAAAEADADAEEAGAEADAAGGSTDANEEAAARGGRPPPARRRSRRAAASYGTASDLARRLRASGMPLVLPPDLDGGRGAGGSVRGVLRSLTQTEGRLLSSTLLSPADGKGGEGGESLVLPDRDRRERITEMWNSIGGLDHVKDGLLDLVFPILHRQQQQQQNLAASGPDSYGGLLSNPPGVLLYGPPGCGKTTLVRALASTAQARVLCVSPSTLLRKYVGETEQQVRALFSLARKVAPCILFVDEVDGLFRERGAGGGGGGGGGGGEQDVSRDLKTEFMQLWDGIRTAGAGGGEQILVVGATNRPFDVDPGFLRRMPRGFFVGLPDAQARAAVLRLMLRDVPLSPDFDVDAIADRTDWFAPSDLREVLRTAALGPLREARFEALRGSSQDGPQAPLPPLRALATEDCLGALSKVAPTQLNPAYVAALTEYAHRTGGVRRPTEPQPEGSPSGYHGSAGRGVYPHPNGYFVHKADDGTFLADIGTVSPEGGEDESDDCEDSEYDSSDEDSEY